MEGRSYAKNIMNTLRERNLFVKNFSKKDNDQYSLYNHTRSTDDELIDRLAQILIEAFLETKKYENK